MLRPVPRWRIWVWGAIYWAVLAPWTWDPPRMGGNVASRYMTIEAIIDRHGLAIERSALLGPSGSPDVVQFGPHLYSDKPPVLPALASPIYGVLRLFGVRLMGSFGQLAVCNFALTWLVVGLASSLTLVALRTMLQGVAIPPWVADLATLAFGFASPLLTYAVTFNNHSVAAGCIAWAWALTLLEPPDSRSGRRRFTAGLLAGLAATIDLPAGGLTAAGLAVFHLARGRLGSWTYFLGLAGPLLLHCWLQSLVTGSPLPAEMYPKAFEYPGSHWTTPRGIWVETVPRWQFGLDFLVGPQGAWTVFPVLWFSLLGLLGGMLGRRAGRSDREAAWMIAGNLAILVWYYVWGVRRTDFAGYSFGVRHLLAIEPMLYLFAVVSLSRVARWWILMGLIPLFALSIGVSWVYAMAGKAVPWSRVETRLETVPLLRAVEPGVLYRHSTFRDLQTTPKPKPEQP